MIKDHVDYMVNRFLSWKLPENFNPDGGISFTKFFNTHLPNPSRYEPSGTNLLDYQQARQMVLHMIEGLNLNNTSSPKENPKENQENLHRMNYRHKRTSVIYRRLFESYDVEKQELHVIYINPEGQIFNRSLAVFNENFEPVNDPQGEIKPKKK